jgi:hypothetical protein
MKLPNIEAAIIPKAKIVQYLLSLSHPVGHDKAEFFMRFGFSLDAWEKLAQALLDHANRHEVSSIETSVLGTYYVIEGELHAIDGRTPLVRVVWFFDEGQDIPRLATAYPLKR